MICLFEGLSHLFLWALKSAALWEEVKNRLKENSRNYLAGSSAWVLRVAYCVGFGDSADGLSSKHKPGGAIVKRSWRFFVI
ncbi:ABC-type phosphate transport system [Candidatus Vecturithrix granuli]|uniref:ABC-type phosphate transport system n=1 Tax=Vecturithrix granuli TaxID=1499967 RepID=A0A081C8T7_VECG1|nr:ABC-type phosphate transport system [Candidatus Vecturithrix granuli]